MINDMSRLPPILRKQLADELQRDERVLYIGQPRRGPVLAANLPILLFALFWCGISFPMAFLAWSNLLGFAPQIKGLRPSGGMAWFVAVFMVPFVLIGAGLIYGFFQSVVGSANAIHAITDSRVLTVHGGRKTATESYAGHKINFVKRWDASNGSGSLEIAYGVERDSDGDPRPVTMTWSGIPDVRRAESAILDLMRRQRQ